MHKGPHRLNQTFPNVEKHDVKMERPPDDIILTFTL